jgi:hypothetical protein
VRSDPTTNQKKIDEIISACENRMDISYFKYGPARENFGSGRVDAAKSADLCLTKFMKTRNTEYLLDVINYAIYGIMYPLPGDYFRATDSDESAGTYGTPINMEKGD